ALAAAIALSPMSSAAPDVYGTASGYDEVKGIRGVVHREYFTARYRCGEQLGKNNFIGEWSHVAPNDRTRRNLDWHLRKNGCSFS
ncbi:MAG: hypothetical protein ACRCYX_15295, partial [Dermatophilaceae bacterium]